MIDKKKVFLASSEELVPDRREFEIFIGRKNKSWIDQGVFIDLIVWEDFLDALGPHGLQQEYNRAIRACDLFVMLFWTRVGRYTEEEFDTAFGQFQATRKPFVFTYYKDAPLPPGGCVDSSLAAFQAKLKALGHYQTRYSNTEGLLHHFAGQLDKLVAKGFIEFRPNPKDWPMPAQVSVNVPGSGAAAVGPGAKAVGERGVLVEGNNSGDINTGTRIDTGGAAYVGGSVNLGSGTFVGRDQTTTVTTIHSGLSGGDLEVLFANLLAEVVRLAPPERMAEASARLQELKTEVRKGKNADDGVLARIVNGLADLVPKAVGALAGAFAAPLLQGVAGPVTKIVLEKLKGG